MTELEVVQEALGEWLEFRAEQKKQQKENRSRVMMVRQEAWQYPDPGSVKLNVSSSWEEAGKGVGLGIIARNDTGTVLQDWSVAGDAIINPMVAETDAACVAQQNGWRNVEVQVDVKALADCLEARKSPVVEAIVIAEDIYLLAMMFVSCKFSFGHKMHNRSSSRLASLAPRSNCSQSWKTSLPQWLQNAALLDIGSVDRNVT